MLTRASQAGIAFDRFATGHYARVEYDASRGRHLLKKAGDTAKDQSYFLCYLSQEQLARAVFPLGDYTKTQVRSIAGRMGLPVKDKPESQDFVAGDYTSLLGTAPMPGHILDSAGNILGRHKGICLYTVGQRKGLGLAAGEPMYVTAIDPERNAVIVGSKQDVYRDSLVASDLNWMAFETLEGPIETRARIRYRHDEAPATVTPLDGGRATVTFSEPQMAVTPGQAVVFYDGDVVLGGGTIEAAGLPGKGTALVTPALQRGDQ
jgi:tRNA-specific 2-thiouridylase